MKQIIAACVLFLAALGSVVHVFGKESLAKLDEILQRHVQALGGHDNIEAVRSVVQHLEYREGSFVIPDAFIARMRPYYKTIGDPRDIRWWTMKRRARISN
jgi:hypothetical protein